MPIESLPGKPIEYPITHFQPVQARPVIPTAAYAAQIARALGELAKQLSPEERKRHQLELELLNQKSRQVQLENEYRETMIPRVRGYQSALQGTESRKQSILGGLTGAPDLHPALQAKPVTEDYPDTHPADLSAMTMGDTLTGGTPSVVPTPLEQSPPEETPPVVDESADNELPATT